MPAVIDHALRLRSLWIAWLLAMLFHVDLGLMPLFHGISPEIHGHVDAARLPLLFGAMLAYFLLPLAAIVLIAYAASDPGHPRRWRLWRACHFWISIFYTLTNIPHLAADILVPDARADQIVLMLALVVLGLLINREGWLWWRCAPAGSSGRLRRRPRRPPGPIRCREWCHWSPGPAARVRPAGRRR